MYPHLISVILISLGKEYCSLRRMASVNLLPKLSKGLAVRPAAAMLFAKNSRLLFFIYSIFTVLHKPARLFFAPAIDQTSQVLSIFLLLLITHCLLSSEVSGCLNASKSPRSCLQIFLDLFFRYREFVYMGI